MEKRGIVIHLHDGMADVVIQRTGGCGGNCDGCASCESKPVYITLPNTIQAKVGEEVEIISKSGVIMRYAILFYTIPLLALVLGMVGSIFLMSKRGIVNYEVYGFIIGFIFLGFSLIILRILDKKLGKKAINTMELHKVHN